MVANHEPAKLASIAALRWRALRFIEIELRQTGSAEAQGSGWSRR
jgi:hypothetical protein